jgi:hypothetical protein
MRKGTDMERILCVDEAGPIIMNIWVKGNAGGIFSQREEARVGPSGPPPRCCRPSTATVYPHSLITSRTCGSHAPQLVNKLADDIQVPLVPHSWKCLLASRALDTVGHLLEDAILDTYSEARQQSEAAGAAEAAAAAATRAEAAAAAHAELHHRLPHTRKAEERRAAALDVCHQQHDAAEREAEAAEELLAHTSAEPFDVRVHGAHSARPRHCMRTFFTDGGVCALCGTGARACGADKAADASRTRVAAREPHDADCRGFDRARTHAHRRRVTYHGSHSATTPHCIRALFSLTALRPLCMVQVTHERERRVLTRPAPNPSPAAAHPRRRACAAVAAQGAPSSLQPPRLQPPTPTLLSTHPDPPDSNLRSASSPSYSPSTKMAMVSSRDTSSTR